MQAVPVCQQLPSDAIEEGPWNGRPKRVRVPYSKLHHLLRSFLSSTRHEKARVKLGSPLPKAKYSK